MADWNLPLASSLYVDVLTYLKLRDIDAITLCFNEPTNIADHSFKYERTANYFQEYESGTWRIKILSVLGGGTGANNPNDIRINLGLGSMALQAASAVAITGGTMNGVAITNATQLTTTSNATIGGILTVNNNVQSLGPSGFFGVGANLTNLNGNNIDRGMVGTAFLGNGTANAATYLRGDRTWAPIVVNPSRWTHTDITTSLEVTPAIINAMSVIGCFNSGVIYVNLPAANDAGIANPASPLRIFNYYGYTVNVYQQGGGAGNVGGRNPFVMEIPRMSIDLIPNPLTNTWNIF